jgi:MoaA/NifB/PqqE/SkfB family radical SAM enzyme
VILTGGEPSLHPELPRIARYATDRGLHVRMITNGWRMADPEFAREMAAAGLKIVHVSVYSVRPDVEERCAAPPGRSRGPSPRWTTPTATAST